jgi:hypothetical protein
MAGTIRLDGRGDNGEPKQDMHVGYGDARGDRAAHIVGINYQGADRNYVTTERHSLGPQSRLGSSAPEIWCGDHAGPRTHAGSEDFPSLQDVGAGLVGALGGLYFGFLAGGFIAMPLFAILFAVLGEATYIPGETSPWDDYRFAVQLIIPGAVWGLCALGGTVWGFLDFYRKGFLP